MKLFRMSKDRQREVLRKILENIACMDQNEKSEWVLRRQIQDVEDDFIISEIGMADLPLILLLMHMKYGEKLKLIPVEQNAVIRAGENNIANMSYLAVQLHFLEIKDGRVCIEGITSVPAVFGEGAEFCIIHNGIFSKCDLTDKNMDQKIGSIFYEQRRVFRTEIIPAYGENKIQFANVIYSGQMHICPYGKINAMRFFPVSDCLEKQYCVKDGYVFYIRNGMLCFRTIAEGEQVSYESIFQKELMRIGTDEAMWAVSLRNQYFAAIKNKKKPIWLFMDRVDQADDNAEILYRYVKKRDEVDAYYIIREDTKDYERLKELGGIVPLYSPQHDLLVLLADYVISSQANGVVENPFWEKAEYVRDLYHQAKIIFLQHGVIKDDMSSTLNRYHTNFTGFITSSPAEWASILREPYDYPEEKVWLTGLPRFDMLYNNSQKCILIMPSWRKEFVEQEWDEESQNMVWRPKGNFSESRYVKVYRSLLSNRQLAENCKKYGYHILFMPHALMKPYLADLMGDSGAEEKSYREAFAEGSIMVTDYSSVAFDFAYLLKPIIYYQFDKEEFFSTHTYQRGYFDYDKDGFGEVVCDEEKLVNLLIAYMEKGCSAKEVYRKRMEEVFAYRDGKACKRVYDLILKDMREGRQTEVEKVSGKDLLIRDLKNRIKELEQENEILRAEKEVLSGEVKQIQYYLDETRKSFSYRLGYALTGLPRKLRRTNHES